MNSLVKDLREDDQDLQLSRALMSGGHDILVRRDGELRVIGYTNTASRKAEILKLIEQRRSKKCQAVKI